MSLHDRVSRQVAGTRAIAPRPWGDVERVGLDMETLANLVGAILLLQERADQHAVRSEQLLLRVAQLERRVGEAPRPPHCPRCRQAELVESPAPGWVNCPRCAYRSRWPR